MIAIKTFAAVAGILMPSQKIQDHALDKQIAEICRNSYAAERMSAQADRTTAHVFRQLGDKKNYNASIHDAILADDTADKLSKNNTCRQYFPEEAKP